MSAAVKTKPRVPELRFPEFAGEWEVTPVIELLERASFPATVLPEAAYREIGVRSHGKGLFHKSSVLGSTLGAKRVFHVVPNALVLNIVFAWEQALALTTDNEKDFIASHRFPMFTGKRGVCNVDFIRRFFLRKRGKWLLELASPGGAGRNKTLGQDNFGKLPIAVPTLPEQEKIAEFLGAVDGKLVVLREKHKGLERFKRGLMQKLFSRTLRFTRPDGTPYPDWEEKRLGEILTIRYGKDHKELADGEVPVFGTGGVMRYVDRSLHSGPSVLIGRKGTIDQPRFVTKPFWTVDTLFYSDINDRYVPYFAFLVTQHVNWLKYSEATGVPSLSASVIGNVKVEVASDPEEQQKIADALSALDAKIAAVSDQITRLESFKRGLLQKMFV